MQKRLDSEKRLEFRYLVFLFPALSTKIAFEQKEQFLNSYLTNICMIQDFPVLKAGLQILIEL